MEIRFKKVEYTWRLSLYKKTLILKKSLQLAKI